MPGERLYARQENFPSIGVVAGNRHLVSARFILVAMHDRRKLELKGSVNGTACWAFIIDIGRQNLLADLIKQWGANRSSLGLGAWQGAPASNK